MIQVLFLVDLLRSLVALDEGGSLTGAGEGRREEGGEESFLVFAVFAGQTLFLGLIVMVPSFPKTVCQVKSFLLLLLLGSRLKASSTFLRGVPTHGPYIGGELFPFIDLESDTSLFFSCCLHGVVACPEPAWGWGMQRDRGVRAKNSSACPSYGGARGLQTYLRVYVQVFLCASCMDGYVYVRAPGFVCWGLC